MKYVPWIAFAVLLAIGVRAAFPIVNTVPGIPIIVTDTIIVNHFDVDTIIEIREHVITDTVTLTRQVVISDPVYLPCPDFPRTRGITRLTVGESHGDTTLVSVVDLQGAGSDIAVQRSVEKLYTPGPLLYLEASDPVRYDFGTFTEPDTCGFGCKLLWYLGGVGTGAVVWELAR